MAGQIIPPTNAAQINIATLEEFYFNDLLNQFKTDPIYNQSLLDVETWIQANYNSFSSWKSVNKVKLAVQRLIANLFYSRYPHFLKIYPSPISSDIAFETNDAIINIDSKTVSHSGNAGDFEKLFFKPNQASFNHKGFGKSVNNVNTYPGMPINFSIPPIDPFSGKPVFTFFIMYKYYDDKVRTFSWYRNNEEPNVKFICLPNGDLSSLFNYDLGIKGAKTYHYEKIPNPQGGNDIFNELPLNHPFPNNAFQVEVGDRFGWYLPRKDQTWLPYPTSSPTALRNTLFTDTCRIQFSVLKDRLDSNNQQWDGVSTWQI